jgi:hypothetical protein
MVLINRNEKSILIWGPIWIALTFLLLFGCATTKPNLSIVDPGYTPPKESETSDDFATANAILTEISHKNNLLAIELGKLPELQDGISTQDKKALEIILDLYQDDAKTFDHAFAKMYRTGLPEVRQYCSPLQAVFWLAEDDELSKEHNPLVEYSLKKLLDRAWRFNVTSDLDMAEDQLLSIIKGIKVQQKRKEYLRDMRTEEKHKIQEWLVWDYRKQPRIFTTKARKMIENSLIAKVEQRWGDFNIVTNRLNSPELIDYYERKRFTYHYETGHGGDFQEVKYVFKHNKGHCLQISAFTEYCLKKAGYRARIFIIVHPDPRYSSPLGSYHRVCLFEVDGRKYVMDNGRSSFPRGIVPYSKYNIEMGYALYEEAWKEFQ